MIRLCSWNTIISYEIPYCYRWNHCVRSVNLIVCSGH